MGEPCADAWPGLECCHKDYPIYRAAGNGGGWRCFSEQDDSEAPPSASGAASCRSGSVTGTVADLALCVPVALRLSGAGVVGELEPALFEALEYLAVLSMGDNRLNGSLPQGQLLGLRWLKVRAEPRVI